MHGSLLWLPHRVIFKAVSLTNLEVIEIVSWRDFQRPSAKPWLLHCRMPRRSIRKSSPESSRARLAINIGIGNDRDASALWHPVTSCDLPRPNKVHQGPHQATSPSWKWVPDPEWAPRRPGQWGACSDHPAIFSPLTDCCVDAYLSILNPSQSHILLPLLPSYT